MLRLEANYNTLKCELKCTEEIDFSKENSIESLLGFTKKKLKPNKFHQSDFPVDIMKINMIRVKCKIVSNSFSNGNAVHTLHAFYPTVAPCYEIVESPLNLIYLPINTHVIHNITLKIVDQHGRSINFREEVIGVTLHLRKS